MWPGITPAEIEMCKGIGCYSVEDVANMTEEALSRFLGSRALRDKARAYMAAAKDAGKVSKRMPRFASGVRPDRTIAGDALTVSGFGKLG